MPTFLADELTHLRHRVAGGAWRSEQDWAATADEAAELVALAVHLLGRVEAVAARAQPRTGEWDEAAARAFIPLFKQWFDFATGVRDLARACREHGHRVEGTEEFLHGYNRSKMMALDFDSLVESGRRIDRGEAHGRPLDEVMDELRRRDGTRRPE